MLGHHVAAGHVVNSHQVKIAAAGKIQQITIQEHDRNAGFRRDSPAACWLLLAGLQFRGAKKTPLIFRSMNCLQISSVCLRLASVSTRRIGGAAPQQAVFINAGQAGDFTANDLENLGVGEARHEQAQNAGVGGALVVGAHIGA